MHLILHLVDQLCVFTSLFTQSYFKDMCSLSKAIHDLRMLLNLNHLFSFRFDGLRFVVDVSESAAVLPANQSQHDRQHETRDAIPEHVEEERTRSKPLKQEARDFEVGDPAAGAAEQ